MVDAGHDRQRPAARHEHPPLPGITHHDAQADHGEGHQPHCGGEDAQSTAMSLLYCSSP